jgi:hypothetical protein
MTSNNNNQNVSNILAISAPIVEEVRNANNNINLNNNATANQDRRTGFVNAILNRNAVANNQEPRNDLEYNMNVLGNMGIHPILAMGLKSMGHSPKATRNQSQLNLGVNQSLNQNQLLNQNGQLTLNSGTGNPLGGAFSPRRAALVVEQGSSENNNVMTYNNERNNLMLNSENSGNDPGAFLVKHTEFIPAR